METETTLQPIDVPMHEHGDSNDRMENAMSATDSIDYQYTAKRNANILSTMDSLLMDIGCKDAFASGSIHNERNFKQTKDAEDNVALRSALQVANAKYEQLQFDHQKEIQVMAEKHGQSLKRLNAEMEIFKSNSSRKTVQNGQIPNIDQNVLSIPETSRQTTQQTEQSSALNDEIIQLKRSLAEMQEKHEQIKVKLDEEQNRHRIDLAKYHEDWQRTNMELRMQINTLEERLKEYKLCVANKNTEITELRKQLKQKGDYADALRITINAQNETINRLRENLQQQKAQIDTQSTIYAQKTSAMQHEYMKQLQRIASGMSNDVFSIGENLQHLNAGVLKQPKKEENNLVDRKPLTPISELIEDSNGQERKCNNCAGRAKFKMVIAYCNSDCIKNYW